MLSDLSGSPAAIFDRRKRLFARAFAGCFLALASLVTLAGCDAESLSDRGASARLSTAMSMMGPDAQTVMYADVRKLTEESDSWEEALMPGSADREEAIAEFEARTGIDLEQDLDAVYVTAAFTVEEESMSAVLFGDFDTERLRDVLAAENVEPAGGIASRDGFTAYELVSGSYIGVGDDDMVVFASDRQRFSSMMTDSGAGASAMTGDALFERLSDGDAWFIANDLSMLRDQLGGIDGSMRMMGPVLQSISRAGASFQVDGPRATGRILLAPRDDVRAKDLANVIRGGISATRFQLSNSGDEARVYMELLETIEVDELDGLIEVSMSIHQDEVQRLRSAALDAMN